MVSLWQNTTAHLYQLATLTKIYSQLKLFRHLRRMRTVFSKHACRRKFAEFVTYHILGDKNGIEGLAVVHQKRVADKVRRHHRAS